MFARRLSFMRAAALGGAVLILTAAAAHAQPAVTETNSPYTRTGPVGYGPLAGYSGQFATPVPLTEFGTTRVYGAEALRVYEIPGSIFMTSINYPGQYGAYTMSVPALTYNTRPGGTNTYGISDTYVQSPRQVLTTRTEIVPPPAPETGVAYVNVLLPSEAELTFDGTKMPQTGSFREFVTPTLTAGKDYTYTVRASWPENGRDVTREQVVHVAPGKRVDVDFMNPPSVNEPPGSSTLRTRPLPER